MEDTEEQWLVKLSYAYVIQFFNGMVLGVEPYWYIYQISMFILRDLLKDMGVDLKDLLKDKDVEAQQWSLDDLLFDESEQFPTFIDKGEMISIKNDSGEYLYLDSVLKMLNRSQVFVLLIAVYTAPYLLMELPFSLLYQW